MDPTDRYSLLKPLLHPIICARMSWLQRKIPDLKVYLKLFLHPIIRVYTRKCAAYIVEKYEHSLVLGYQRFVRPNKVYFSDKSVSA